MVARDTVDEHNEDENVLEGVPVVPCHFRSGEAEEEDQGSDEDEGVVGRSDDEADYSDDEDVALLCLNEILRSTSMCTFISMNRINIISSSTPVSHRGCITIFDSVCCVSSRSFRIPLSNSILDGHGWRCGYYRYLPEYLPVLTKYCTAVQYFSGIFPTKMQHYCFNSLLVLPPLSNRPILT